MSRPVIVLLFPIFCFFPSFDWVKIEDSLHTSTICNANFSDNLEKGASKGSVVVWETPTEHDFGKIKSGSVSQFAFKFKNISDAPIIIEAVRTTCGCTAAKWTEEPVSPNGIGQILIEFDSEQKGDFRKKIRVFFDKQKKAEMLWVEGSVI